MPDARITEPTEFAHWKASGAPLFDDHLGFTETVVCDGPNGLKADLRLAYGRCRSGFWFFVSMTRAEEAEFRTLYLAWRVRCAAGLHQYLPKANGTKPANCGTPNTPPCVAQLVPQLNGTKPANCGTINTPPCVDSLVPPTTHPIERCGTGCRCAAA